MLTLHSNTQQVAYADWMCTCHMKWFYMFICSDFHELEAKFIQQESKYLVLLRESQEPRMGQCRPGSDFDSPIIMYILTGVVGSDAGPSALVSQMVEEAIEQDERVTFNEERSG